MDDEQSAADSIRRSGPLPQRFSAKVLVPYLVILSIQFAFVLVLYLPVIRAGHADFRNRYAAGYMVRTGRGSEIYNAGAEETFQNELVSPQSVMLPFIPPPYEALFFAPFTYLPFRQAYFLFLAFNLAILFLCMMRLRPYMFNLARIDFRLPSWMFLFFPITVALMQGQDSILLLALLAGAFICIQRNREGATGALVALGLIKFQMVIPIFLLFLAWRRWRFSAAFVCTSAALAGISIWIVGINQMASYLHGLIGAGSSLGAVAGPTLKMNMMANIHGALCTILKGSSLALPLTAAVSAVVMILAAIRRPSSADALLVAIPASALVSYYMYPHDLCVVMIPAAVILDRMIGATREKYRYGRMQTITASLLLAAPTALMIDITQFWIVSLPLLAFTVAITVDRSPVILGRKTAAC